MQIKKIEIKNVKGISHSKYDVEIFPNKPNILVAPNGFGKTSIATAFKSLKKNCIKLDKNDFHNEREGLEPFLKLFVNNGNKEEKEYFANSKENNINDDFDVFIISNRLKAASKTRRIKDFSATSSSINIEEIKLVSTIPKKKTSTI